MKIVVDEFFTVFIVKHLFVKLIIYTDIACLTVIVYSILISLLFFPVLLLVELFFALWVFIDKLLLNHHVLAHVFAFFHMADNKI